MKNHPNAVVGGSVTGGAGAILWALDYFAGIEMPGYVGAWVAGAAGAALLLVGREGLVGVGRRLLFGSKRR